MKNWSNLFFTFSEKDFLSLAKNFVGPLHSPFNKKDIIKKLELFFESPEIQKNSLLLVDEKDRLLLLSILWADNQTPNDFARTFSLVLEQSIRYDLLNLQERLLVYSDIQERREVFSLTPLGVQIARTIVLDWFIPSKKDEGLRCSLVLNKNFWAAILSWSLDQKPSIYEEDFFLSSKRIEKSLHEKFPHNPSKEMIYGVLCAIKRLGFLDEEKFCLCPEVFQAMDALTREGQLAWLITCLTSDNKENLPKSFHFWRELIGLNPFGRFFEEGALEKLMAIIAKSQEFDLSWREACEKLCLFGLIKAKKTGYIFCRSPFFQDDPGLIIQANWDILVQGNLSWGDWLHCFFLFQLHYFEDVSHYTITKESLFRFAQQGGNLEDSLRWMERTSRTPIPQNIFFNFNEWKKEASEILIFKGVILKVNAPYQVLLDNLPEFSSYVKHNPMVGMYLLDEAQDYLWMPLLAKVGLNFHVNKKREIPETKPNLLEKILECDKKSLPALGFLDSPVTVPVREEGEIQVWMENLRKKIHESALTESEKKEALIRLKRKVILCETQIQSGIFLQENLEVKGFHFQNKLSLIAQILETPFDLLWISFVGKNAFCEVLVRPLRIEKKKTLFAKTIEENSEIVIEVEKIARMKKVKPSIF